MCICIHIYIYTYPSSHPARDQNWGIPRISTYLSLYLSLSLYIYIYIYTLYIICEVIPVILLEGTLQRALP